MWEKSMKAQGFIKVVDFGPTFVWVKHSPQVSDTRSLRETRQLHRQALRMLPHDNSNDIHWIQDIGVAGAVRFNRADQLRAAVLTPCCNSWGTAETCGHWTPCPHPCDDCMDEWDMWETCCLPVGHASETNGFHVCRYCFSLDSDDDEDASHQ